MNKKIYNYPTVEVMQINADMHLCAGSGNIQISGNVVNGGNASYDPANGL